ERPDRPQAGADCHTNGPDWVALHCNDAESSRSPLALAQASAAAARADTPHQGCDENARRRHFCLVAGAGRHWVQPPYTAGSASLAEGKSRPLALPTKRGSLSKVSMAGRPCSRTNCTTTSSRLWAAKS